MPRSKVKSRSDHDAVLLHPLTNVPTKYQHPTPYGFQDIAWTRFYRSRSLWQDQRSNQGHTMTLHTLKGCGVTMTMHSYESFPRLSINTKGDTEENDCHNEKIRPQNN